MNTTQQLDALRLADIVEQSEGWTSLKAAAELRRQHARISELEAARIAYASEFEPDADGDPDVGNIHANIRALKAQLSAIAHTAEGATAQTETLRAELAEETEAAENWRRLALQFDNHRLQALGHIKAVVNPGAVFDAYKAAKAFLNAPPLDGEEVLAQRIAELSAATQAQADAQDTDRWMGIGKAIERACADLPEETEIIVSLEKDAGTVTLIDQDGNEHENFSCDYGFAGVMNEAIDAAIAAQAKN